MMTIDDKQVFIGSFNLDPRSAKLNTEIGVLLNSTSLATAIHTTMNHDIDKYSYQLQLTPEQKIQWLRETPQFQQIYQQEPRMKWWQKAGLQFVSWLPIEGMM